MLSKDLEVNSQIKARAKRLKIARSQTALTRVEIERRHGVNKLTQANWENSKGGGLTEKGAKRMVHVLKEEGVFCTVEWLMHGAGTPPYPVERLFAKESSNYDDSELSEIQFINEERFTFKRIKNSIDFMVCDDGMMPLYSIGEFVGGIKCFGDNLRKTIGQICIVELKNQNVILRHVRAEHHNRFTLVCINPDATVDDYILHNQELLSAAPVIWHRKRNNIF